MKSVEFTTKLLGNALITSVISLEKTLSITMNVLVFLGITKELTTAPLSVLKKRLALGKVATLCDFPCTVKVALPPSILTQL